jgi:formylglycine-generating enzyme required for sulfatase activity
MPDRLALIIANSDFDDPKLRCLKTPVRDAEALAEVLGDPEIGGFDVTLLVDEPMATIRSEISRLYARRKRSDLLLLYYSGHGIRDEHGDLYLATRNTEMGWVDDKSIEANYVRARMDKSGSQRKVVILDCCHSGAFAKGGLGDSVGTRDAFEGSGYGRVILTASDAVELAWEGGEWLGEDKPSIFTHFLVEGLRTGAADLDHDGKIALDELYEYVYERVLTSGYAKQTPHKWAQKVQGQIVVARALSPKVRLPAWISEALSSGAFSARLAAVGELARLVEGEDKALVAAARAELKRVGEEDDNPAVRGAALGALGARSPVARPVSSVAAPSVVERRESRPDVLTITSPIHLELVRVPAGAFLMGSDPGKDKDAEADEQPQHTLDLPGFYIGKYPVTNAQYAAFVEAMDHRRPKHWNHDGVPSGKEDHPVFYVSWDDALAFCQWLSRETGKDFTLPSEAEWEKAARGPVPSEVEGTDGRIYPWGNQSPTADLCNFALNVGGTTPVGTYSPQGDSPCGCADMVGNVWEWTRSLWRDYPYDPEDGREDLEISDRRVLRGGSFFNYEWDVRCAYRGRDGPDPRNFSFGFRVVCGVPHGFGR